MSFFLKWWILIGRERESLEILERLGLDFVALDNIGNVYRHNITSRGTHTLLEECKED